MFERISRNFRIMAIFSLLDDAQKRGDIAEYSINVNAYQVTVNVRGETLKWDNVKLRCMDILPSGYWVTQEEYVYDWF